MTPEKRYALDLQEQDRLRNNKPIEETIQRNSDRVMKDTNNNLSSLHNPFNNPFNSQIAKDTDKLLKLNDRKEKMKVNMSKMITDLTPFEFDRFESTMIEYQLAPRS
ncbi:hypothetical protein N8945_01620 [Candidatus Pelagibacter sp.]|nr:hypothetical protein [Candidatus Pelagibacter sp.]|tara:strand:- start:83 stop:403 length:321 start_codon:yes stop_codon:yes gene_type:complete